MSAKHALHCPLGIKATHSCQKNHIVEILIISCWLLNSLAKFDAMLYLYRLVHNVSSILLSRLLGLHLALRMNREVTVNRLSTTDCGSSAGARAEQLSGPAQKVIVQKFNVGINWNEIILKNWKPRLVIYKYYTRLITKHKSLKSINRPEKIRDEP